jgi:hypothetical protein
VSAPAPGRAAPRLLAVLMLAVLSLPSGLPAVLPAGLPSAAATPEAGAPHASTPDGPAPIRVSVTGIAPQAPRPGDTLTLGGSLVNVSRSTYHTVTVRLRASRTALVTRTEVRLVHAGTGLRDGQAVDGTEREVASGLRPKARADWSVSVPVDDLALRGNGVYVIGVEVLGSTDSGSGTPERIGLRKTLLPWMPRPELFAPTRMAWLWPLADRPARDARGAFTTQRAMADLTQAVAAGGRLDTLAAAPRSTPVTWLVDPDLLESVAALGAEHSVREGRRARPAKADPAALRWLDALRQGIAGQPVAALPYADPDLSALVRNNQSGRIGHAVARGATTATTLLSREVDKSLAWPPDGLADARTLDTLRAAGAGTVILDSATITPTGALNYTPTGRATVVTAAGSRDALVADSGLTTALASNLDDPGTATLAAQLFLADTALITLERPNIARTVLVAPPRRWSPPAGWLARLLTETGRAPWLQMVGLDALRQAPMAEELTGASVTYSAQAVAQELPPAHIDDVRWVARDAGRVASVLTQPGTITSQYDSALLRAQSSAWRDDRTAGRAYVRKLRSDVLADLGKVRVIGRDLVTLSSNSGTIPVTVTNDLAQSVTLRLALTPKVPSRLRVAAPEPIRIGPGRKTTIKMPAVAYTNGLNQVDVQLLTPDGVPYGPATNLRVNATSYGNVGLVVVFGAGLLLLVAAGLRNIGRVRRARARARAARATPSGRGERTDQKVQA